MTNDLTPGQAAKLSCLSATSINRYFDSGKLKGYKIPGSKHRRIPRKYLMAFLKRYGVPTDLLEKDNER